jgi:hypothetical protein
MLTRVSRFAEAGVVLKPLGGGPYSIAYGEVLTVERARQSWRLVLHTAMGEVNLWCKRNRLEVESEFRGHGLRIVDCWGAIISPTLADFEDELDREPLRVRQSSDNAYGEA